jgi:hypothetical protein
MLKQNETKNKTKNEQNKLFNEKKYLELLKVKTKAAFLAQRHPILAQTFPELLRTGNSDPQAPTQMERDPSTNRSPRLDQHQTCICNGINNFVFSHSLLFSRCNGLSMGGVQPGDELHNAARHIVHVVDWRIRVQTDCMKTVAVLHRQLCKRLKILLCNRSFHFLFISQKNTNTTTTETIRFCTFMRCGTTFFIRCAIKVLV